MPHLSGRAKPLEEDTQSYSSFSLWRNRAETEKGQTNSEEANPEGLLGPDSGTIRINKLPPPKVGLPEEGCRSYKKGIWIIFLVLLSARKEY